MCAFATATAGDGLYDLRARAVDALGNQSTSAVVINRRIDNTAPAGVTMTDPGSMSGTVTLSGAASDSGSGMATLTFQRATPGSGAWTNICVVSSPTTTCSFNTVGLDGLWDLRVVAADNAGNGGLPAGARAAIDNTPPSANMANPGSQLHGT